VEVNKGVVTQLAGPNDRNGDPSRANVMPKSADGVITRPLTIPWWLRGRMGMLKPGDEVAYAVFEDATGVILSRMDGERPED